MKRIYVVMDDSHTLEPRVFLDFGKACYVAHALSRVIGGRINIYEYKPKKNDIRINCHSVEAD